MEAYAHGFDTGTFGTNRTQKHQARPQRKHHSESGENDCWSKGEKKSVRARGKVRMEVVEEGGFEQASEAYWDEY